MYGCGSNGDGELGIGHNSNDKEGNAERSFVSIPSLTGVKFFGTGSCSDSSFAALS